MPSVRFVADASPEFRESLVVTPAVEPLSLRLPRDLLVLQPMQGHLDLEAVLLAPGLRCVIGSAESCAVRLAKSALVQPKHCTVEVVGRQTMLTDWMPEVTWLNDRLITECCELVSGDRISVGPFDFRVRPASADELLYAKLIEREPGDANKADDVLRLKRAIENSGRDKSAAVTGTSGEPALDLFSELLRETSDGSDTDSHERLTQHISKLLGDLQNQVVALQDKEAELNEQLRSQREVADQKRVEPPANVPEPAALTLAALPGAVRPEYEHVLQLLKSERDQLDRERSQLADEQVQWQEQQRDWSQRLQTLELQLADLEAQRQAVLEERDLCRTLAAELMRDEARMAEWEDRLRHEERELNTRRDELSQRVQGSSAQAENLNRPKATISESAVATFAGPGSPAAARWSGHAPTSDEPNVAAHSGRPVQTLLTLVAFSLATLFLSGRFGDQEVSTTIGWATAILGALSTVDLLLRRCFSTSR